MAIFHLSVKVISRSSGRSAVAAAAYRGAERLHDERLDRDHDFTNKDGVVHSEVMLPEGAPEEFADREKLWNAVEAAEKRKDAQLAREVEFAIPRELSQEQGIELAREFAETEFVEKGMIADLNVHWDIGADGQPKPHAHVMLTMREIGKDGFGAKVREWNKSELVEQWRERWADHVNQRLAELDIDARIDHRSLEAQGIDLEPQDKIGPAASRMGARGLETERIEEHRAVAQRNGERIIANPNVALDAITHQQATFTGRDLTMFVHRHSDGKEQFDSTLSAVRASPDLIALGKDGRGEERFTSRDMLATEERLQRACERLAMRHHHGVPAVGSQMMTAGAPGMVLGNEQQDAVTHIVKGSDIALVVGYAGTGKSAMLGVAREAWEEAGYTVRGAALSGIAAEGLESGSGIASRTIASLEHGWAQERGVLTSRDVLVIDEAGMVGTRQMERVLSYAADTGAKIVLVGDPQQLQAIEAGAAFRAIHERHGGVEITEVRRQHEGWQQDATRYLATGRTGQAIHAYEDRGMVHAAETREVARGELIDRWDRDRQANPDASRIILTHTNDDVRELNEAARGRMRNAGDLGSDVSVKAERGERQFASGDRIVFLRNERGLGVKNGTLGTVEHVSVQSINVRTDDGRSVAFDTKDYAHVDHGYAATIHKAQGMTVDHSHVLATPGMDSHSAYVGMSRHRDGVDLHYGRDDFAYRDKLVHALSRERSKDMASDYNRADSVQTFAERHGISFRERVADVTRKIVPGKLRGMFDGLRLAERVAPQAKRGMFDGLRLPAPAREALQGVERSDTVRGPLASAIQRHASALDAIGKMKGRDLAVLPHIQAALDKSRAGLDATGMYVLRDWEQATRHDPSLVSEAAGGRTQRAIRALQLEAEIRTNPELRADRFVERWQKLGHQSREAVSRHDYAADTNVRKSMSKMLDGLHRDPQLESVLQGRRHQLGLKGAGGIAMPDRDISRELSHSMGLDRGRGIGIAM